MNIPQLYRTIAQRLRSFTSVNEMNESINAHVLAAGRKLHKNARAVLSVLTRHSCAVTGVSWIGIDTIANAINVCERTVKRAIERIESLGIGETILEDIDGIELRFFVLRPFRLSEDCRQLVISLSDEEIASSPTGTSNCDGFSNYEAVESVEPAEKEKDDDEYMNSTREDKQLNVFQTEIYEQAIDNGFERHTALAIASKCESVRVTIMAIQNAYSRVLERLDSVSSIPSYFAKVVNDMQTKLDVKRAQKALQLASQAEYSGFVPYNWLEEAV